MAPSNVATLEITPFFQARALNAYCSWHTVL